MNLTLIDTPLPSYPHLIEWTLHETHVIAVYFNRKGNHFAGCCNNGYLLIWDVMTMMILRSLFGHAGAVTCASWSKNGRYIASGGLDWKCLVWDISKETILHTFQFDTPVLQVAMHPHRNALLLVSLAQSSPVLVDASATPYIVTKVHEDSEEEAFAMWDVFGEHFWTGSVTGVWRVVPRADLQHRCFEEHFHAAIRHFALSTSGRDLAITLADKTVRLFGLLYDRGHAFECVPIFKLQDPVNRQAWSACAFTPNAAHIVGATIGHAHVLHVWSKDTGTLATLLEGPPEPILHFTWHPTLPCCISVSQYGTLVVWSTVSQERWSAYTPGFQEIEENIEYVEREDEFDHRTPGADGDNNNNNDTNDADRDGRTCAPPAAAATVATPASVFPLIDLHTPVLCPVSAAVAAEEERGGDDQDEGGDGFPLTVPLDMPRLSIPTAPPILQRVRVQSDHEAHKSKKKRVHE